MAEILGPRNVAEVRDDILTDIRLTAARAGIDEPIGPNSDNYVWATGVAGAIMLCHARIDGNKDACTADTATGEDILRHKRSLSLPDLPPGRATGRVVIRTIGAVASITDGQPLVLANGAGATVIGPVVAPTDGQAIEVIADLAGEQGNARAGSKVTFTNPPANLQPEGAVSPLVPLTGGTGIETEASVKIRVLNKLGGASSAGNWSALRDAAQLAVAGATAFVYPACGGPGTTKVVLAAPFDRERGIFTRETPDYAVNAAATAIHRFFSSAFNCPVESVNSIQADASFQLTLTSTLSGGAAGWLDPVPWPPLYASQTRVRISAINSLGVMTIDAGTAVAPVAGITRIAWWSQYDMKFHVRTVTAVTGSAGAWVVTPDAMMVDGFGNVPTTNDFVCPPAVNSDGYAASWLDLVEALGPGEQTAQANLIENGRALRRPRVSTTNRIGLSSYQESEFVRRHQEIEECSWSYRQWTNPAVPSSVADAPNILVPRHFGVYPTL